MAIEIKKWAIHLTMFVFLIAIYFIMSNILLQVSNHANDTNYEMWGFIIAVIAGIIAVQQFLIKGSEKNRNEKINDFIESVKSRSADQDAGIEAKQKFIVEQLAQMSDTLSNQLRTNNDAMREIKSAFKDFQAWHEENKQMDTKQQEQIDTLKEDVRDLKRRMHTVEISVK